MDAERIREQWAEIDRLNQRLHGITVLKGVEVDILERGGLDLDDDTLAEADWVMASIHYGQKPVARADHPPGSRCPGQSPRLRLCPSDRPHVKQAEALRDRHGRGDAAAAKHGKMLELNAHPVRLDLDDVACAVAKGYGIPVVISTDSHRVEGLAAMRYGILQARRGGLEKADVANTRTWPQVKKMLWRT